MAYGKRDDTAAMNRKYREAGFAARGLDDAAMSQSSTDKADGFISEAAVGALAHAHGEKAWRKLVDRLLAAGRWHRSLEECARCLWNWQTRVTTGPPRGRGWFIHDFGDYYPMGDAERDRLSERGRKGAAARHASSTASGRATSGATSRATSRALANGTHAHDARWTGLDVDPKEVESDFETVWQAYPAAKPRTRSRKGLALAAYAKTRAAGASADDLLRAVESYAREQDDPGYVMGCQVFFGPDEPWRSELEVKPARSSGVSRDEQKLRQLQRTLEVAIRQGETDLEAETRQAIDALGRRR